MPRLHKTASNACRASASPERNPHTLEPGRHLPMISHLPECTAPSSAGAGALWGDVTEEVDEVASIISLINYLPCIISLKYAQYGV
jgi:hypothetical protein